MITKTIKKKKKNNIKDFKKIRDAIEMGYKNNDIKFLELFLKYKEDQRSWKTEVTWVYGFTDEEQEKEALQSYCCDIDDNELYRPFNFTDEGLLWCGYDAHENVWLTDLEISDIGFCKFKRLLDRYPSRVEQLKSSRQFLAKKLIITTFKHPSEYYKEEDYKQYERLIDNLIHWQVEQ